MKQKIIGIILILCLLISMNFLLINKSYADTTEGTNGSCKWELDDNGTLTVHEGTLDSTVIFSDLGLNDKIKKVVITENVICTRADKLFKDLSVCEEMDLSGLNISNATLTSNMFYNCASLKKLDLSTFNTSNITDMFAMFDKCTSLTEVNLSSFDTSKVNYMGCMFEECKSLTSLNLNNFDTTNVQRMDLMFYNCSSLKTILSKNSFSTDNCKSSSFMFYNCTSLVGGNGTKYSESHMDNSYAKLDNDSSVGYFTYNYDINITNQNNICDVANNINVPYNNNQSIVVTPNVGYEIVKIKDNDKEVEVNSKEAYTYILNAVQENHNIEIQTKAIEYVISSGDNQEVVEKKAEDITITSDGLSEIFIGFEINGVELVKDKDYTIKEENTTSVVLSKDYLNTLEKGEYKIKFKFSNGSEPNGIFKIVDSISNNGNNNQGNSSSTAQSNNNGTSNNNNSNNASTESNTNNSAVAKIVYTGDKVLKVTVPIIAIILLLNYAQIKFQKNNGKKKVPRISKGKNK